MFKRLLWTVLGTLAIGGCGPLTGPRIAGSGPLAQLFPASVELKEGSGAKIINGEELAQADWRSVVNVKITNGGCTGTVVGPKVILLSAHCAPDGTSMATTVGAKAVTGKMLRSSLYPAQDHDLGLMILDAPVTKDDVGVFASISGVATIGQQIYIMGYGCTTPGGGTSDGKLRGGLTSVTEYKGFDAVSKSSVAVCYGDSGGPALRTKDSKGPKVVGVSSKGNIQDTSYSTRTDLPDAQAFFKNIASQQSLEICGVNGTEATCGTVVPPAPPPDPTSFVASTGKTDMTLTWVSGGGTSKYFQFVWVQGPQASASCVDGGTVMGGAVSPFHLQNLQPKTTYSFRLCALNDALLLSPGVTLTATTLGDEPPLPPPPPTSFVAIPGKTDLSLSWASAGGSTSSFQFAWVTGQTPPLSCQEGGTLVKVGQSPYVLRSLTPKTFYSFRLCAINGQTPPDFSTGVALTAQTLEDIPVPPGEGGYPAGFAPAQALSSTSTLCSRLKGLRNTVEATYGDFPGLVDGIRGALTDGCDAFQTLQAKREFDISYVDLRTLKTSSWPKFLLALGSVSDPTLNASSDKVTTNITELFLQYEPHNLPVLTRCLAQGLEGTGPAFTYLGAQYVGYLGFGENKPGAGQHAMALCSGKEPECQVAQCWVIK